VLYTRTIKKKRIRFFTAMLVIVTALGGTAVSDKVYKSGDPGVSDIAITIDDCFDIEVLERMLDLFLKENVRVTFFPAGSFVRDKDGDIWRRVITEGHEIGNHTQNHRDLTKLKLNRVKDELRNAQNTLNRVLGFEYPLTFMRPPYGSFNANNTLKKIYHSGYDRVIFWSVSQRSAQAYLKDIRNGSVCLFHTKKQDLKILSELIPQLKEKQFNLVTVSELFRFTDEKNLNEPPGQ